MKILLISPYSDIAAIGLRTISSNLKLFGHSVVMAFLPHSPQEESRKKDREHIYPDHVLTTLGQLAAESQLIGISLMTNYIHRVRLLSASIRNQSEGKIVWGGIHPTLRPQDADGYADYAIIGEGEDALVDLLDCIENKKSLESVPNLAFPVQDRWKVNPPRPLIEDLDRLPFPDYNLENHFIWDRDADGLIPMSEELLKKHLASGPISKIKNLITYQTLATRGCPHRCAYCCNDSLQALYKGQRHLRRRSDENVFQELEYILEKFPFVEGIGFSDDSFFAAPDNAIELFAKKYQQRVRVPFFCLGSPLTITDTKLRALSEAGLYGVQMGVQTGSRRLQELYNRSIPNEKILAAVKLLHQYSDRMVPPAYDFIIDSPWENDDDIQQTLQLIRKFPRPYRLQLFSLVIFPETGLYHQALKDNFISGTDPDIFEKEYHSRKNSYSNFLLGLYTIAFPKTILATLSHPILMKIFNRPLFNRLFGGIYRVARIIKQWVNRHR